MLKARSSRHFYSKSITAVVFLAAASFSINVEAQSDRLAKSFAEITKRIEPAVVSIETKGKTQQVSTRPPTPGSGSEGNDVMDFLRRQMQQKPVRAVGSGFIVEKAGYIVTNAHVVEEASRITVKLDSGEEYTAKVIGTDEQTDLAVLKIDAPKDLPFVRFGDSDKAEVGDWVLAIGSPFGLAKTVTAGIISQKQRETPFGSAFQRFIQTDAAINRGNSGGPLVNIDGEVIGVNSQIATSTGDYNGIGFALPSKVTESVLNQIIKNGKVRRGYLGAYLDSVKVEFAKVYGLKDAKGAIITDVRDPDSPAAIAGLKVGDIVTEFNGQQVESAQDLIGKIASTPPDQMVSISFMRENGDKLDAKSASIKLRERPTNRTARDDEDGERRVLPVDGVKGDPKPFGLTVSELSPILVEKYKLGTQKGLVVKEINPASFIADVKDSLGGEALGEGDLIQRINRVSVTDLKAFNEMVSKLKIGDPVVLHIISYNPRSANQETKIVQFTVR
ncbi:MAG TPA: Do family serine endopeptidase [Pyrinomonadaceae bacterium]|nr:Do family serine endopeptidase [Acidobacteriota bacterium]HQZ96409.1 Do family serine endopeptidase [Pyrinomonadaceae bacterium]